MPMPTLPPFPWTPDGSGGALPEPPWGSASQIAPQAEEEGVQLAPYGMGDCRTFMDIPPIVHLEDGSSCVNPDFAAMQRYSIAAVGRDPALPDQSLVVDPIIAPGNKVEMQVSVQREENGLGHFLITELLMFTDPPERMDGVLVELKTQQGDRVYTNVPVPAYHVFGNSHLSCCLPCPIMLYPNQTLIVTVHNRTIPPADVKVRIVARGKRFLPYHDLNLAREMERCWGVVSQSTPFWLGMDGDNEYGEVSLPVGFGTRVRGQASVPGGGFFEMHVPMAQILPSGGMTPEQIDIEVTDGRIGRRAMDGAITLGGHYAATTRTIVGFPGDAFRAASACHCPPPKQLYRGNTRLIHDFTNQNDAGGSCVIRMTYAGCMHYVDRCPPQEDLDLVRRYGIGDANALARAQRIGDKAFLSFLDENPLYAEEQCEVAVISPEAAAPQAPLASSVASQAPVLDASQALRIVRMWRPAQAYYGPSSAGALPWHMSFAQDAMGVTHLVVRDPATNSFVRFATEEEHSGIPWASSYVQSQNASIGMGGLGGLGAPKGEWGRI